MCVKEDTYLIEVWIDDDNYIQFDKHSKTVFTNVLDVSYNDFMKAMKTLKKEVRKHQKESFEI